MEEVIMFDKSLQQRYEEYLDVLYDCEPLAVSQVRNAWSVHLQLSLDPSGWQAIWKTPCIICELYKIPFPTIVLVYVENVDYEALAADVKVLTMDNISLPDKHFVPLIQLWPTKDQDETNVLDIQSTANALDMLRFFYNNVIMPWDYEDDTLNWRSEHLESRLKLFYDMKNGVIPKPFNEHLHALLTETRSLQSEKEELEKQLYDEDLHIHSNDIKDGRVQAWMDIQVRIIEIRGEIEIWENPLMRKVILKQQQKLIPKEENSSSSYFIIFDEGKIDECITLLNQVKIHYPNEDIEFVSNLTSIIGNIHFGDTVILGNTKYILKTVGQLKYGGIIKGIFDKHETVISSTNKTVLFDLSGDVLLENITISANLCHCGVLVRNGNTTLTNCMLLGDGKSSTHQGIIVLDGSNLTLVDCEISNFYTAIVGNSRSKITMKNCVIHNVNFGVKIHDDCIFSAENSNFYDCQEYAFSMETNRLVDDKINDGNFAILQNIPHIKIIDVNGNNNGKGDAIINMKQKIQPVRNMVPIASPENKTRCMCAEKMEIQIKETDVST